MSDASVIFASLKSVEWRAHSKAVCSLALTSKGNLLASGDRHGKVRLWNFHGMSRLIKPQHEFEPASQSSDSVRRYPVESLSFHKMELAVTIGDKLVRIYDASTTQCPLIGSTLVGDMYVRDTAQTRGHSHSVTKCLWRGCRGDGDGDGDGGDGGEVYFASGSLDNTVRIFDLYSQRCGIDSAIPNVSVLKCLDARGSNITQSAGVASLAWQPGTGVVAMVAGCADGSVQLWRSDKDGGWKPSVKPTAIYRPKVGCGPQVAGCGAEVVRSLVFSSVNQHILFARSATQLNVWDVRKLTGPVKDLFKLPDTSKEVKDADDADADGDDVGPKLPGGSDSSNSTGDSFCDPSVPLLSWSFRGHHWLVTPAPPRTEATADATVLLVYDAVSFAQLGRIPVKGVATSLVGCDDQLLVGLRDGRIVGYYLDSTDSGSATGSATEPGSGSRGVHGVQHLEHASQPPEGAADELTLRLLAEGAVTIHTPYDLPENVRETPEGEFKIVRTRRPPAATRAGAGPYSQAGDKDTSATVKFQDDLIRRLRTPQTTEQEIQAANVYGSLVTRAYAQTQPTTILDRTTPWESEEKYLFETRKCPKCGLKMCSCGFMT